MTSFRKIFEQYNWKDIETGILTKTAADVETALNKSKKDIEDFKALISPAGADYLEQMALLSRHLTQKRFGKTVQMYIPMYLSNECQNICTYCGFSLHNKIKRTTLTDKQIVKEAEVIRSLGYDHILLVTGESAEVNIDYFLHAIELIKPFFSQISMEVQPLEVDEYKKLNDAGIYAVLVYQETYHKENYKQYHTKGKKSNFNYRLETPDRLGRSGIHKIGLANLLGLEDWRTESFFTALHLNYLERTYWQTKYSVSFPRLRPAEGIENKIIPISDKELVQLICAFRIFDEDVELSISTRESEKFRNNIIKLGITSMSAGSKTNPGGYATEQESLEQFEINDERTPKEIETMIQQQGYEAVWKDWDRAIK